MESGFKKEVLATGGIYVLFWCNVFLIQCVSTVTDTKGDNEIDPSEYI
jgi:hypothetical protein